jgi:Pyrimidine reductase, riboflavin biosynthesis
MLQDTTTKTIIILPQPLIDQIPKGYYLGHVSLVASSGGAKDLLHALRQLGIESIFVEGGAYVLQRFIDEDLYDELYLERSPVYLHTGVLAPHIN